MNNLGTEGLSLRGVRYILRGMNAWDEDEAFAAAAAPIPLSQRAMAGRGAPYLDDLNPAQRAAVEALDGPVLMLAGAGTGKTKALIARVVHLLRQRQARPNEILAVTFTNKAAREMKDRVGRMLGEVAEGMPWMGTFHSLRPRSCGGMRNWWG
jgi:DNA helicase II / ATP-dependent DNA helicase PcrA